MDTGETYTVADLSLAKAGGLKVDWALSRMPALAALRAKAEKEQPWRAKESQGACTSLRKLLC